MEAEFADEKARMQADFDAELAFNHAERQRLQGLLADLSSQNDALQQGFADMRTDNEALRRQNLSLAQSVQIFSGGYADMQAALQQLAKEIHAQQVAVISQALN